MAKIKIKVTKLAYYNDNLVYPNEVIEYEGKVPSWGTLADGKATKKQEAKAPEVKPEEVKAPEAPVETTPEAPVEEDKKDAPENMIDKGEEKSEIQQQEELEALLDESVAKGIILENAESKTIDEQISELKTLLGK